MIVNPYRHPSRLVRAGAYTAGGLAALSSASRVMGGYAPSASDVNRAYKTAKKKWNARKAAKTVNKATKRTRKLRMELYKIKKRDRPVAKLAKQLKNLQIQSKSDQGELIARIRDNSRSLCGVNAQSAADILGYSTATLESILSQCKFFNPSVPGTLTTADISSGTFQRDIHFATAYTRLRVRNNYQVPARVSIYCCLVKDDTSISPRTAWANGLADIGSVTYTDPMTFPSDSQQLSDLYKIESSVKKVLIPGQEMSLSYSAPKFIYDPSLVDSHNLTYLKQYKCHGYIVVVEGVMGHDTTADEQGNLAAGVDIEIYRNFKVHYSAGAQIRVLYTSDGLSTFTNGGVVSSKPVCDNIGYSVA